jgi:hypothetical protein
MAQVDSWRALGESLFVSVVLIQVRAAVMCTVESASFIYSMRTEPFITAAHLTSHILYVAPGASPFPRKAVAPQHHRPSMFELQYASSLFPLKHDRLKRIRFFTTNLHDGPRKVVLRGA